MKGNVDHKMKKITKQSGFSLIELLVYIAILISAVTVVAVFTVDIIKSNRAEQGNRETQQNARFIMERLQYEIRWANTVEPPFQANEITLQTPSGSVRFYLAPVGSGQGMFLERNGFSTQITTDDVNVSQFELETLDPDDSPPSVGVDLEVESQGDSNASTDISTIITVRKQ